MRRALATLLLACVARGAQPWLSAPDSYTCRIPCDQQQGGFILHVVQRDCTNITICGLVATTQSPLDGLLSADPTAYMFSDGDPITRGPDLAGSAWGWSTGA